jgi:metal-responsive CopG/Arc/MetJ family transcriptional regulator
LTQPPTNNSLVSIRIPKSLFLELQKVSSQNHYLDVSEQVRSIVREKWQEAKDPQAYHLKKLRKEIVESLKSKTEENAQAKLIQELERIKASIVGERNQ